MPKISRSPLARRDLKEIATRIAEESQSRDVAVRFLKAVDAKCRRYAQLPELGEECPALAAGLRCFSVGSYVIFYLPKNEGIEVVRALHGRRDIPSVWQTGP